MEQLWWVPEIDLLEEKVITCSTFKLLGSYTPYGDFLDGYDGYWYGFANQANSSGVCF